MKNFFTSANSVAPPLPAARLEHKDFQTSTLQSKMTSVTSPKAEVTQELPQHESMFAWPTNGDGNGELVELFVELLRSVLIPPKEAQIRYPSACVPIRASAYLATDGISRLYLDDYQQSMQRPRNRQASRQQSHCHKDNFDWSTSRTHQS